MLRRASLHQPSRPALETECCDPLGSEQLLRALCCCWPWPRCQVRGLWHRVHCGSRPLGGAIGCVHPAPPGGEEPKVQPLNPWLEGGPELDEFSFNTALGGCFPGIQCAMCGLTLTASSLPTSLMRKRPAVPASWTTTSLHTAGERSSEGWDLQHSVTLPLKTAPYALESSSRAQTETKRVWKKNAEKPFKSVDEFWLSAYF